MEKLNQQKQNLNKNQSQVQRVENPDLKPQEKKQDYTIAIESKTKSNKPKPKEKKIDSKEQEINQIVANSLKTDEGFERQENRDRNFGKKKQGGNKLKFTKEDFPEL